VNVDSNGRMFRGLLATRNRLEQPAT